MTDVRTDKRTKKSLIEADCALPKNVGLRWGVVIIKRRGWQNFVVLLNDLYDAFTANFGPSCKIIRKNI